MSTAYNYSRPKEVKTLRSVLSLSHAALSFVQLPGWLKNQVQAFMKSYYGEQMMTEASLVAYFEIQNNIQILSYGEIVVLLLMLMKKCHHTQSMK